MPTWVGRVQAGSNQSVASGFEHGSGQEHSESGGVAHGISDCKQGVSKANRFPYALNCFTRPFFFLMNLCFVGFCNWAFLESLAEPVERQMDWKRARRVSDRLGSGYRLYLA